MRTRYWGRFLTALPLVLCCVATSRAVDRFDVFLGFNSFVPEASWFPVVCEIENRGPGFSGTVEVSGGSYSDATKRLVPLELPSGTTKRITIPVFFDGAYGAGWNVRLLDAKGRVRAEKLNLRASKQVKPESVLLGSLSRNGAWSPPFQPLKRKQSELEPVAARIPPQVFPENPIVLTGLDALYLNSEQSTELRLGQHDAIADWVEVGGHLIVAVESISDINSSPWLRELVPMRLTGVQTVQAHPELQNWIRSRVNYGQSRAGAAPGGEEGANSPSIDRPFADQADDLTFEAADLQVATGEMKGWRVLVSAGQTPLILQRPHGLGRVTVLLFSPEREPVRSWKSLPSLWSRLTEVPPRWYVSNDQQNYGRWASDGIFGAMIDSRQIRKLPIGWLLLLLVAYLVVIGPFDRWWLKKIGKPMLTWITFPLYVVLFSGLIYLIGYKLRAGEREWNELHVVDVLTTGRGTEFRGRTYGSLYSPVNDRYRLRGPQNLAVFRGEAASAWGGGGSSEDITVIQRDDSFEAEAYVPVWTSQLYVNDWWAPGGVPMNIRVSDRQGQLVCELQNTGTQPLARLRLVWRGRVYDLEDLAANESKTITRGVQEGVPLVEFLTRLNAPNFQNIVAQRGRAFGGATSGRIEDMPNGCFVASFLDAVESQNPNTSFAAPPGTDLSRALWDNGVLLAWAEGYAAEPAMNAFRASRGQVNTLWRIPIPFNPNP